MTVVYNGYSQDELDLQYNMGFSPYMPDGITVRRMFGRQGPLRDSALINLDFSRQCVETLKPTKIPFGEDSKQIADLYKADGDNSPCVMMLSGGGYINNRRRVWCQSSKKCLEAGISFVDIGQPSMPDYSLSGLMKSIENFIQWFSEHATEYGIDPNKIIIASHSSGTTIMATCLARLVNKKFTPNILGAIFISGTYDLLPVSLTFRQKVMKITQEEVLECSAIRNLMEPLPPVLVCCGDETDEMKRQQHEFAEKVNFRGDAELIIFPLNHFALGMELYEEDSKMWNFITKLCQ